MRQSYSEAENSPDAKDGKHSLIIRHASRYIITWHIELLLLSHKNMYLCYDLESPWKKNMPHPEVKIRMRKTRFRKLQDSTLGVALINW